MAKRAKQSRAGASTEDRPYRLEDYRADIRKAWLPLVGRKKLSSFEYKMIERWHGDGIPVEYVLRAIRQRAGRVQTLYSLGIIKGDLQGIQRQQGRMTVGSGQKPVSSDRGTVDGWRARAIEDLTEIAGLETSPEKASMYRELLRQIPTLGEDEYRRRWREITTK